LYKNLHYSPLEALTAYYSALRKNGF
jgi:hypothetical protein